MLNNNSHAKGNIMQRKYNIITLFTVVALLFSACQVSPEKNAVISKNDGSFETNLHKKAAQELYGEIPIQFSENFFCTDGSVEFQMCIDQTISITEMPVVEVVPHNLTGEDVNHVAQTLLKDAVFYEQEPDSSPQYSKEELQEAISCWSQYTNDDAYSILYGRVNEDDIDALKYNIQIYTELLESASEDNPHKICDWVFKPENYYFSEYPYSNDIIQATAMVDGIEYVLNAVTRVKQDFLLNSITLGIGKTSIDRRILQAQMCRTDKPSQAQLELCSERAQEILNQINLGTWFADEPEIEVQYYGEIPEYSIRINARPVLEGITVLSGQKNPALTSSDTFSSEYYLTNAFFQFSPEGTLMSFGIDSPIEINTVINSDVYMLGLDELVNIAKNHISNADVYAGYGVPSGIIETYEQSFGEKIKCEVTIDSMGFGLARMKTANENYYYIPAIAHYGTADYYGVESGTFYIGSGEPFGERQQALVWINAIDGSII